MCFSSELRDSAQRTEEPPFLCGVLRRWIVGVAVLQCQSPERLGDDDVRLPAFWAWLFFPGLPGCPADRSTVGLHHPCCHGGLWPSPAAAAEDVEVRVALISS